MTIKEYAETTGTSISTVKQWVEKGMPHTPPSQIQVDFEASEEWRRTKLRKRGRPKMADTADNIAV
jgi:hypothetical protein